MIEQQTAHPGRKSAGDALPAASGLPCLTPYLQVRTLWSVPPGAEVRLLDDPFLS